RRGDQGQGGERYPRAGPPDLARAAENADVPVVDDGHAAGGRFESAGWRTGRHQARAWRPRKSRGTAGEAVAGSLRDAARTEFVDVADIDVGIGFAVAGIHVRRAEIGGGGPLFAGWLSRLVRL